jgi:YHS domain-containing protein
MRMLAISFHPTAVFVSLVIGISLTGTQLFGQVTPTMPYRLTPPLRMAQRINSGSPSGIIDESDPFHPPVERTRPTTIAAHGFCVVTLRDHRQWVLGAEKIQAIYDGKVYLFSSPRERDIFAARPERYLPVLNRDCPVTYVETGDRVGGQLESGLIHRQRLYFFASQEKLSQFQASPDAYEDADLVDSGRCIVSEVEEQRTVAGLPQTVAVVDGLRYFFASAFHRKLFLLNPHRYGLASKIDSQGIARIEIPFSDKLIDVRTPRFGNTNEAASSLGALKTTAKRTKKTLDNADAPSEKIENRAMSGYCPVTIQTEGVWQRGKSKFKSTYDGKVYFMEGPEKLSTFQENPRAFVPVLDGDSVVAYVNGYERVPGSVFHAVQYKGRLYLFADAEQKKNFGDQPAIYENADLAQSGNCVVTRIEEKNEVLGLPEFEAIHRGKRYRFASQKFLDKFFMDPQAYADE